ncbi:MAG: hypothetical protein GX159_03795 [Flavobacteriaceae bacterium]|jgi:tetratricopeptide (TPR) repeat protein|nr:hypothetical protein [Flavobacteriaceae bacterium]
MKTIDKHLLNALDNYPYSLMATMESLEYALSYNEKNTMAICLLGRIYAEQLMDYETAKEYFEEAISYNLHALEIYPYYIETLILNEDFDEAEKLIAFALTLKGMDKVTILLKKVWLKEVLCDFKMAKKILKEIKSMNCHDSNNSILEEFHKRIDSKTEKKKKKKSK